MSCVGIIDKMQCLCDCGKHKIARLAHLKSGTVKSCGCLLKETPKKVHGKHLLSNSKEYASWNNLVARCTNVNHRAYSLYGGRGIFVCDEWKNKELGFICFLNDMGKSPEGFSIERINNEKGYSKENCIWANKATQAKNRRTTIFIEHNGKNLCIAEWSKLLGFSKNVISERLKRGWSIKDCLEKPLVNQIAQLHLLV